LPRPRTSFSSLARSMDGRGLFHLPISDYVHLDSAANDMEFRIAVKVINHLGDEVMKVLRV